MITFESKDFTNLIEALKSKQTAETGLLIGYKFQDRHYVYLTCKTPNSEVSHKQLSVLLNTDLSTLGATYSDWALQHAHEIFRFLPAGLQILGFFSVAEEDLRLENFNQIPNSLIKFYSDLESELNFEEKPVIFHYNQLDNKYIAGCINLSNKTFMNHEIRFSVLAKLEEVRCLYRLRIEVSSEGTTQNVIQHMINKWNTILEASVFLVDNQVAKDDTVLCALKQEKTYHIVQIFSNVPGVGCEKREGRVRVCGMIESIVLAHPRSTMKTVKELIIKDLLNSLKNRLETISDDFTAENNPFLKFPQRIDLQLPRRAKFTLNNCVLTAYTDKDIESLQNLVATLATAKPVSAEVREKIPEVVKTEDISQAEEIKSNKAFLIWVAATFGVLALSFIVKKSFWTS